MSCACCICIEEQSIRNNSYHIHLYSAGAVALDMLEPKFDVKLPSSSWFNHCSCLIIISRLFYRFGIIIPPIVVMDTMTPINAKTFKILIEL